MKEVPAVPKRLVICCDGTWQSSVTGKRNIPSNVARLARAITKAGVDDKGKTWQQIVYYDSGVGTGSLSFLEQAREGATGDGLVVNVLEAYNFLVNNYSEGDQIFCFGFSRGAFTARAIAGLVTDIGIFKPENMQSFAPLWALYQRNLEKHDFKKSKEYFQFIHGVRPMCEKGKEHEKYNRKLWELPHQDNTHYGELTYKDSNVVEVVGVFDTVGSLGMADTKLRSHASDRKRFEFLNVKLSPFINHAFHALALDDHREPFLPALWYIPSAETLAREEQLIDKEDDDWKELEDHRKDVNKKVKKHQSEHPPDLYQVWFPGVHINIGGGSDESSADAEGLANITFAWMVQMLGPYLTFLPWTWNDIQFYQVNIMKENLLYEQMKKDMTFEEQKQYEGLIGKSTIESLEATVYDWAFSAMASGKKALGLARKVEMVPVPADNIVEPNTNIDKDGNRILPKWGISEVEDSYTAMYYVMNSQYRSPGEMQDRSRVDGELLTKLGKTNEYIHPSIWWRANQIKYQSKALEGFLRQKDPTFQSWGYYKKSTKIWIPEWFMIPSDAFLGGFSNPEAKSMPEGKVTETWQFTEWSVLDNMYDCDQLQKDLAGFYIDTFKAEKRMETAGKKFPFDVPKW